MLDHENCAGPCATACKPGAGTGKGSTVFESIMVSARANETTSDARLYGRVRLCRSCGAETTNDRICDACADAMREERAATLREQCRIHRVRYVDDLPVSVLEEMQRGRC